MPNKPNNLTGISVLGAFAHPDDEGFGCGGTLAMLVARGARVTVAVGTNGDVGEISDPALATPETLHLVRQEEMRQAMKITGVQEVRFMGYRDSGMAGTPENDHPRSLYQAPRDRVADELAQIIRETRPDAVLTHDPTGGYGHPDHTTMCELVTRAFQVVTGEGGTAQESRTMLLYYVCFPRSSFRRMWQQMLDAGVTPPFASLDIDRLGSPDDEVTTTLDIREYVDTKIESLNCHRTQIDSNGPFPQLPPDVTRDMMGIEYFALVEPQGLDSGADLLAGLQ